MPLAVSDSEIPRFAWRCSAVSSRASGRHCSTNNVSSRRSSAGSTVCAMVTTWDSMRWNLVIRGASVVITATWAPEMLPSRNAALTAGKCCRALPRATVADPTAGFCPVATATIVPVVPAPNTRESWCSSAHPASSVMAASIRLRNTANAFNVPARDSACISCGSGNSSTSALISSSTGGCSVGRSAARPIRRWTLREISNTAIIHPAFVPPLSHGCTTNTSTKPGMWTTNSGAC